MPPRPKRRQGLLYVYNKTRETFVATEAVLADGYWQRLVGLLGKTSKWARLGAGLWIVPSRGVHTMGMLFPIDLIFLAKSKEVVRIEEHVKPFRISQVCLNAKSVLELPAHTVYRTGTRVGDQLEISAVDGAQPKPVGQGAAAPDDAPLRPAERAPQR
jgi:uncharacterized membrane protein (UPF0127 family)